MADPERPARSGQASDSLSDFLVRSREMTPDEDVEDVEESELSDYSHYSGFLNEQRSDRSRDAQHQQGQSNADKSYVCQALLGDNCIPNDLTANPTCKSSTPVISVSIPACLQEVCNSFAVAICRRYTASEVGSSGGTALEFINQHFCHVGASW